MLYISSILCLFYLGGMGYLTGVSFLGQTITGGTIVTFYMYISKFFTPHPKSGRAIQLAAIGAGFLGKGVLHHGH